jgi:hypothetical protein
LNFSSALLQVQPQRVEFQPLVRPHLRGFRNQSWDESDCGRAKRTVSVVDKYRQIGHFVIIELLMTFGTPSADRSIFSYDRKIRTWNSKIEGVLPIFSHMNGQSHPFLAPLNLLRGG